MSSLVVPQWMDWTSTYGGSPGTYPFSTGYRRITNLLGGSPSSQDLEWLSEFNQQTVDGKEDSYYAPIWSANPKYLWFLDTDNQKLKISDASDSNSYTINPVQDCKDTGNSGSKCNKDCCSTSSTLDNCIYSSTGNNLCSGKHGFSLQNQTCDLWTYLDTPTLIDPGDDCGGQDKVGTFCNKMLNNAWRMKSYLGCDCDTKHNMCFNMDKKSCIDTDTDDPNFCSTPNPEYTRAEWKFIDDTATVACCSLPQDQISGYEQCQYAFNPSSVTNKCSPVMQDFCTGHWGDSTQTGVTCNNFLSNSPMNATVTQQTIQNYITDPSRTPEDYISRLLAQNGNQLSIQYYMSNGCDINKAPSDCDTNPDQPCCRDDSKDPFFMQSMPYMCNFYYGPEAGYNKGGMQGVCDPQLQYFCQEFSRDDLAADITLQNICGCFLLTTGPVSAPTITGANQLQMSMTGEPQSTSPYYDQGVNNPGGAKCDVLCNTANVQSLSLGGPCEQQVCMIDNVTINQVNSQSGDINFDQECGGGTCYISNVDIEEAGSSSGAINLSQNCGTCYTFDGNNINNATQVNCDTLDPIGQGGGGPIKGGGGGNWFKENMFYIILFALIFGILTFVFFSFMKHHYESGTNVYPPGSTVLGEDYWSSAY